MSAGISPRPAASASRTASGPLPLRIAALAAVATIAAASTRRSSNGSRATGRLRRAIGMKAKPSARRSGPRRTGIEEAGPGKVGLRPEATRIVPSGARAAAAHEVGPWTSRPFFSAIPPRRSGGSGWAPFDGAPFWLIRAASS